MFFADRKSDELEYPTISGSAVGQIESPGTWVEGDRRRGDPALLGNEL